MISHTCHSVFIQGKCRGKWKHCVQNDEPNGWVLSGLKTVYDILFMVNVEILSLWIMGAAAIFGLQSSLAMAMRHHLFRNQSGRSQCDRLLGSPQAYIGKVPVALFASIYYLLLLGLLFNMFFSKESAMDWISLLILISLSVTVYYAWLLFFKLRIRCMECIRIQIYNLLIVGAYLSVILGF